MPPACSVTLERLAAGLLGCVRRGQYRLDAGEQESRWHPVPRDATDEDGDGAKLVYVGAGRSSYSSDAPPPPPTNRSRPVNVTAACIVGLMFILVGVGFCSVLVSLTHSRPLRKVPPGPPEAVPQRGGGDSRRTLPDSSCAGPAEERRGWTAEHRSRCCEREGVACAALA
mmetsp:Transcript_115115/g.332567  ORF Transcript_115115/g.332567 Transcript_115115/m.332567 type:complete len:170 (-) Transcript_115115:93-602(-)